MRWLFHPLANGVVASYFRKVLLLFLMIIFCCPVASFKRPHWFLSCFSRLGTTPYLCATMTAFVTSQSHLLKKNGTALENMISGIWTKWFHITCAIRCSMMGKLLFLSESHVSRKLRASFSWISVGMLFSWLLFKLWSRWVLVLL